VARARLIGTITLLAGAATPGPAFAHATNTGFGPFYDGLAHLVVTPEDLLTVIAVALCAAQHGARDARRAVGALPAAWLAGIAAGAVVAPAPGSDVPALVLMIALGAIVAAGRRLPELLLLGLAVVAGLWHGFGNGANGAGAELGLLFVAGVGCGVFVLATLVGGQAVSPKAAWSRVAVRVAGSWIAAVGLLMLGWTVRGGS
jgi:hydrogenase/urease accessory protein HupE